jgi:hypothetical protein
VEITLKSVVVVSENQEPILDFQNLQSQRQSCIRLERLFQVEENIFVE